MSRRQLAFRAWAPIARGKWANREAFNAYMRAYMRKRRRFGLTAREEDASGIITGWLL